MLAYFCPYKQVTISARFIGLYMSKRSIDSLYDYQCFMGSKFFGSKRNVPVHGFVWNILDFFYQVNYLGTGILWV